MHFNGHHVSVFLLVVLTLLLRVFFFFNHAIWHTEEGEYWRNELSPLLLRKSERLELLLLSWIYSWRSFALLTLSWDFQRFLSRCIQVPWHAHRRWQGSTFFAGSKPFGEMHCFHLLSLVGVSDDKEGHMVGEARGIMLMLMSAEDLLYTPYAIHHLLHAICHTRYTIYF